MTHPIYHAESSARLFGGSPEDYMAVHRFLDSSKDHFADFRHRAVYHHSHGIFIAEQQLGEFIINSDGKKVPVRYISESHILEDLGKIPTLADWLSCINVEDWMARATPLKLGGRTRRATS